MIKQLRITASIAGAIAVLMSCEKDTIDSENNVEAVSTEVVVSQTSTLDALQQKLSLSEEDTDWLAQHLDGELENINDFLDTDANLDERRKLVRQTLQFFQEEQVTAQGQNDKQGQKAASSLTSEEQKIFNTLSSSQRFHYLYSGYLAQSYAKRYYEDTPKTQRNGKGDAFRHTAWNALSAIRLGVETTKRLTDAHEVLDNGRVNNALEESMDLFNNAIGRGLNVKSTFVGLMEAKFAVDLGRTQYITPTNADGSVQNGVSQLKFTNQ